MNVMRMVMVTIAVTLAGCGPTYTLVSPGPVPVANKSMTMQPSSAWNKVPKWGDDPQWEESWTRNGPLLETIAFVGGVPDGQALVKQKEGADQRVPVFHANMSPDDLVSMVETYYRIGGISVFEVSSVTPRPFLAGTGVQMDFRYVGSDQLPRKGRSVMEVVNQRLYVMKLEGAASHYFDAALPEFEKMVASAAVR